MLVRCAWEVHIIIKVMQSKQRFTAEKNVNKDNIHMNNKTQDIDNRNYWDIIRKSLENNYLRPVVVNYHCQSVAAGGAFII